MAGSIYIKCNECGRQRKMAFVSMGGFKCECGANSFMMNASSKHDEKPDWWDDSNKQGDNHETK